MPRRVAAFAALLVLACMSPGCLVTSLQPIYDDASLEVDETLVGSWQAPEQGATAVVERAEWKSYRVTYATKGASYTLVGYLTRLGDSLLFDLTPAQGLEASPLMIPAHGICRVHHEGDTLTVEVLDYDWLRSAIKAKKIAPLDVAVDSRQNLLVASSTATVRAWLSKNLRTPGVFREPVTFTRSR